MGVSPAHSIGDWFCIILFSTVNKQCKSIPLWPTASQAATSVTWDEESIQQIILRTSRFRAGECQWLSSPHSRECGVRDDLRGRGCCIHWFGLLENERNREMSHVIGFLTSSQPSLPSPAVCSMQRVRQPWFYKMKQPDVERSKMCVVIWDWTHSIISEIHSYLVTVVCSSLSLF